MLHAGQFVLDGVIFISSVVFPLAKNGLIPSATSSPLQLPVETREWFHELAAKTAKYSRLDVFVVAVLIVVLKVGDMTEVTVGSGTFLFIIAIAMSCLPGILLHARRGVIPARGEPCPDNPAVKTNCVFTFDNGHHPGRPQQDSSIFERKHRRHCC